MIVCPTVDDMVPIPPFNICQVTALLNAPVPLTTAVNWDVVFSFTVDGVAVTTTEVMVGVAVFLTVICTALLLVASATDVALMIAVTSESTMGAM